MELRKGISFYERKTQAVEELTSMLQQLRLKNKEVRLNEILIYFENKYGFSRVIRDRISMEIEDKKFLLDDGQLIPIRNKDFKAVFDELVKDAVPNGKEDEENKIDNIGDKPQED